MSEEIRVITKAQYEEYMELKKQVVDATKKVRWKPKEDEAYFYITPHSKTRVEFFNEQFDEECWSARNCFKTREEAQKEVNRRIAEQELLDLCDWSETEKHVYVIEYDVKTNSFDWDFFYEITSPYRFASEESVKKAINKIGEEKLKLIFRIGN